MHGWSMNETTFLHDAAFRRMLDQGMATGELLPQIVVTPTYYPTTGEPTGSWENDGDYITDFVQAELCQSLLPAVETAYRTYAAGGRAQDLIDSRQHRAFAGFSMGAITTWSVLEQRLAYFAYFAPMAGDSWTITNDGGLLHPDRTAKKLIAAVKASQPAPFHIEATVGSQDGTQNSMTPLINRLRQLSTNFDADHLSYWKDPNGGHTLASATNQFAHAQETFFKKLLP